METVVALRPRFLISCHSCVALLAHISVQFSMLDDCVFFGGRPNPRAPAKAMPKHVSNFYAQMLELVVPDVQNGWATFVCSETQCLDFELQILTYC